jgi:hypothetical protein
MKLLTNKPFVISVSVIIALVVGLLIPWPEHVKQVETLVQSPVVTATATVSNAYLVTTTLPPETITNKVVVKETITPLAETLLITQMVVGPTVTATKTVDGGSYSYPVYVTKTVTATTTMPPITSTITVSVPAITVTETPAAVTITATVTKTVLPWPTKCEK